MISHSGACPCAHRAHWHLHSSHPRYRTSRHSAPCTWTQTPSARYYDHLLSLSSTKLNSAYLQVIATRPVQGISLSLFSEHGYRALEVLARTSMPVRRLTILIVDASAPNELFPQLAARLPHLEALHIVALVQHYDLVRTHTLSLFLSRVERAVRRRKCCLHRLRYWRRSLV